MYCSIGALMIIVDYVDNAYITVAILIRNSRDAYRLRQEKLALAFVWAIVYIFMFSYPLMASDPLMLVIPPVFFHLFGLLSTFCISSLLPLYYVHLSERSLRHFEGTFDQFVSVLDCPNFRNEFYKYLTMQFCGENLQFYETVQEWKTLHSSDQNKRVNAQLIYDHFVQEHGLCEVNIPAEVKEKIREHMAMPNIPEDTFDEAYSALLHDMFFNSFIPFRSTPEFRQSTTTELI